MKGSNMKRRSNKTKFLFNSKLLDFSNVTTITVVGGGDISPKCWTASKGPSQQSIKIHYLAPWDGGRLDCVLWPLSTQILVMRSSTGISLCPAPEMTNINILLVFGAYGIHHLTWI